MLNRAKSAKKSQPAENGRYRNGGSLVARAYFLADRVFARLLKEHGIDDLNPAQGRIMFALWQQDGISVQQLAAATSLGKTTLTSMLERLESAGHIRRVTDPDDRRSILLFAAVPSPEQLDRYQAVSRQMTACFYHGLSEKQIDRFEEALRQIIRNLDPEAANL